MERTTLINFLNAGKGLYIEGCDFGYDNRYTPLYPMFGCAYTGDGSSSGNVQTVTGQSGTFVSGKDYNYLYQQGPDSYVDYISAVNGTIFFKSQDNQGRAVNYNGPAGEYRAIHSTFIFGALRNGIYNKNELMGIYVDYLGSTIGIEELTDNCVYDISVFPNPFRQMTTIKFQAPSSKSRVTMSIYDATGRLARSFPVTNLCNPNKSVVSVYWDGTDNSGKKLSSGTYIVRIKTKVETISKVIILAR